jgi:hypothetical protein
MNTKLLVPTLGALLLCSSTLALAGDWHARDQGAPQYRGWHDGGWSRAENHWNEYRHYRGWPRDRWYPAYPHRSWTPAPAWRHDGFAPRGYDRDGVTIIFHGPLN